MRCMETGVAMAFENTVSQVYGFQFHPESFLTQNGNILFKKSYLLSNFKEIKYNDLWNKKGIFTTIRVIGRPYRLYLFDQHLKNLNYYFK